MGKSANWCSRPCVVARVPGVLLAWRLEGGVEDGVIALSA
jgi:hypothetical protein